jgi:Uma2 family endonuclease
MSTRSPFDIDPDDPRAPSEEVWATLSEDERARLVDALPSEIPSALPPEGDRHRLAKDGPLGALQAFFRRTKRRIYLSSDLPVYYPDERMFAPDLIAVTEVEPHERDRWVVSAEGKGLDLALEVLYRGDDRKDLEANVVRYARLGITEYFIYDRKRNRLVGYALPAAGDRAYQPLVPQEGRWLSRVLGLELALESERVRLYAGTAPLPELLELALRGDALLGEAMDRIEAAERRAEEEAARAQQEAQRAQQEAQRAQQEAQRAQQEAQRADAAEQRVAELEAELERLRGR